MNGHQNTNPTEALTFMLAGKAIVSLKSLKSGDHITLKIRAVKEAKAFGPSHFVSVRTNGEDGSYAYIGVVKNGAMFERTSKSKLPSDAPAVLAARWAFANLSRNQLPPSCEIWHEGKCGRCARTLTHPESIANGIGPECARKVKPFCVAA